jgi:type I restriction enzyme R subunit
MPKPEEHKTVQARTLKYAKGHTLFFDDLLDAKVREFNPCCTDDAETLLAKSRYLHTDIYGNREFVEHPGQVLRS